MSALTEIEQARLVRRLTANFPAAPGPDSPFSRPLKFKPLSPDYWKIFESARKETA